MQLILPSTSKSKLSSHDTWYRALKAWRVQKTEAVAARQRRLLEMHDGATLEFSSFIERKQKMEEIETTRTAQLSRCKTLSNQVSVLHAESSRKKRLQAQENLVVEMERLEEEQRNKLHEEKERTYKKKQVEIFRSVVALERFALLEKKEKEDEEMERMQRIQTEVNLERVDFRKQASSVSIHIFKMFSKPVLFCLA